MPISKSDEVKLISASRGGEEERSPRSPLAESLGFDPTFIDGGGGEAHDMADADGEGDGVDDTTDCD